MSERSERSEAVLEVRDLEVTFGRVDAQVRAVRGISYTLQEAKTLAVVGESGSGKSASAKALMRLFRHDTDHRLGGSVWYQGVDLLALGLWEHRAYNGAHLAMVYQDALSALNPVFSIGWQIAEPIRHHQRVGKKAAFARAVALLDRVGIASAERRARQYPHEFSGGMRQRVCIAMAIAVNPAVLIADEPTTALDVTVQAQILDLLRDLQSERGMAMLMISHDLGLVSEIAHDIRVMYAGRFVEGGPIRPVHSNPRHPYTRGLVRATPSIDHQHRQLVAIDGTTPDLATNSSGCSFAPRCELATDTCRADSPDWTATDDGRWIACHHPEGTSVRQAEAIPVQVPDVSGGVADHPTDGVVLRVRDLEMTYAVRRGTLGQSAGSVRALDGVSLELAAEETLAVVGESGCGKTTLARAICGLLRPTAGSVEIGDQVVAETTGRQLRNLRRHVQIVFQDPYSSLNPRMSVERLISEGWRIHGERMSQAHCARRVAGLLDVVGLPTSTAGRYPHQLSGGQLQRVSLARALAVQPRILVCDEPTSALDVSVQAQVLYLLGEVKREFALSCLFISHDLGVVSHVADRVAVMYLGRVVEMGETSEVLKRPQHPYTSRLIATMPHPAWVARPARERLFGEVPGVGVRIEGCSFRSRCSNAQDRCATEAPALSPANTRTGPHSVACHFPERGSIPVLTNSMKGTSDDAILDDLAR